MKKLSFLLFLVAVNYFSGFSQGCLPGGITFNNQQQIDYFQTNYPGCTKILGNVKILGDNISTINGLIVLDSVMGDLEISYSRLYNFSGLNNLVYIGGNFNIFHNDSITTLQGMESLTKTGGNIDIWDNGSLMNLQGINAVDTVNGYFWIIDNSNLQTLFGLDAINYVWSNFQIEYNPELIICQTPGICSYIEQGGFVYFYNPNGCASTTQVIDYCENANCLQEGIVFTSQDEIDNFQDNHPGCISVMGDVEISGNDINDLSGLSIITNIEGSLIIYDNDILLNLNGFDYLTNIGGDLEIYNNPIIYKLSGMDCLSTIGGEVYIYNNSSLHNFTDFGSLTEIGGDLIIDSNTDVLDIEGFEALENIYGSLIINNNPALKGVSGFDSLSIIGDSLVISNNESLINMTALNSTKGTSSLGQVEFIGGDFSVRSNNSLNSMMGTNSLSYIGGSLNINDNVSLYSLTGLNSLSLIGGSLNISGNISLVSISTLNNLSPFSIEGLTIAGNTGLSSCAIQSICDYLVSPAGVVEIHDNAPGCNSQEEVEEACWIHTNEVLSGNDKIILYPNPATDYIKILSGQDNKILKVKVFNISGKIVINQKKYDNSIDISSLIPGLYTIEMVTEQGNIRRKLIVK